MNEVEAEGKIAQEDKTVSVSKESKTEKVEEDWEKVEENEENNVEEE